MALGGEVAFGKVGLYDASGLDEFAFAARGEWFDQDCITVVVVQDHEVLATAGRGDRKLSSQVRAGGVNLWNLIILRHDPYTSKQVILN